MRRAKKTVFGEESEGFGMRFQIEAAMNHLFIDSPRPMDLSSYLLSGPFHCIFFLIIEFF